jgi:spore maturation protein SpmA
MSAALTLVPATVIDATAAVSAGSAAMIRLPHGIVIELEGASPSWIAALARELARSAS